MARWQLALVVLFAVAFVAVTLASGEPAFLIPIAILAALIVAYGFAHALIARRTLRRHGGSWRSAMSDEAEPIPSAPDIPDDVRPAGDTPEAHDEISPHDLPMDHPGRKAAEDVAGEPGGTTRGNVGGRPEDGEASPEQQPSPTRRGT